jgi:hypothetical protein
LVPVSTRDQSCGSVSSLSFTSDQAIFADMRLGSGHSEIPAIGENAI